MPLYEYKCAACSYRFELIQKFSDTPETGCPNCSQPRAERVLTAPAIQFKGSGWYITDYNGKKAAASRAAETPSTTTETKTETTKPTNTNNSPN